MIDAVRDLWADTLRCSAICITTNGTIKSNGRGVMGRGVAAQALRFFPGLDRLLGRHLQAHGNHVGVLIEELTLVLVAFPVKYQWHEAADLDLIKQSAEELAALATIRGWRGPILLPRPGCGNGQRTWEEVRPIIAPLLDDRFIAVTTA